MPRFDDRPDSVELPQRAAAAVAEHIRAADFPCLGARSALNTGRTRFGLYPGLGDGRAVDALCTDLQIFSADFPEPGTAPVSFIAMFEQGVDSEADFERRLWQHLQAMHDRDRLRFAWDAAVSADPSRADFSFSIAGRAFFVVGLHPLASRLARRAPLSCLVFNFHDQFENFRASGKYDSLQQAIRKRDAALQGSINPVLARFGEGSEARQYAGRAIGPDWRCPFRPRAAKSVHDG